MRVYLDTSVISALFDERNPERRLLTEEFFGKISDYEAHISQVTVAEIERAPDVGLQEKMRKIVLPFAVLPLTEDVESLAQEYVNRGAVPEGYPEDAYHIAIAVIHEMDYLLSWNFKHIVRKKTRDVVDAVNAERDLKRVEIMTPAELL